MKSFELLTKGHNDIINITDEVEKLLAEMNAQDGLVTIFVPSTTAAVTIMEYEEGAIADLQSALEQLAPSTGQYKHNAKWGDMNGYAHVRGALMKPSVAVPVAGGKMMLGKWQSIVLIDFDNQSRTRVIHVSI